MSNTNDEQKKQWKKDAQQLKQDLDQRQKLVQKNEVEIKVGNGSTSKPKNTTAKSTRNSAPISDDFLRSQINWES